MQKRGRLLSLKSPPSYSMENFKGGKDGRELYLNFPIRLHAVHKDFTFTATLPHTYTYYSSVVFMWLTIPEGCEKNMIQSNFMPRKTRDTEPNGSRRQIFVFLFVCLFYLLAQVFESCFNDNVI